MSELYQKGLISEDDLRHLSYHYHYMMTYSSRHWLDSLVNIQSFKSADVRARTFDTLRRYSLTEVGKETQTKHTGVTVHYIHLHGWTNCVICNFVGVQLFSTQIIPVLDLCIRRCLLYHLALLTYSNVRTAPKL